MPIKKVLTCLGIMLCGHMSFAQAELITLDPHDSGEILYEKITYIVPPGHPPPPPNPPSYRHDDPLENFSLLWADSAGCLCEFLYLANGYVVYDLSSLGTTIQSASLEFDLGLSGDVDFLTINTVDNFTPAELALLPSGGTGGLPLSLGEALFEDMGSGTQLGSLDLSGGDGIYNVVLNNAALDMINTTGGLLAIGLNHPSYSFYSQADINFRSGPRLILDDGITAVPAPGTLWLFLSATLLFLPRSTFPARHRVQRKGSAAP